MNIVDKIKTIPGLYHLKGCKTGQIKKAQEELNIEFPDEFIDYVKEYGAISFKGIEWTGLNTEGYLNVVEATKSEREMDSRFPKDCFVLENKAIDGLLILVDESGSVFSYQSGHKPKKICNSISEYLETLSKN